MSRVPTAVEFCAITDLLVPLMDWQNLFVLLPKFKLHAALESCVSNDATAL